MRFDETNDKECSYSSSSETPLTALPAAHNVFIKTLYGFVTVMFHRQTKYCSYKSYNFVHTTKKT